MPNSTLTGLYTWIVEARAAIESWWINTTGLPPIVLLLIVAVILVIWLSGNARKGSRLSSFVLSPIAIVLCVIVVYVIWLKHKPAVDAANERLRIAEERVEALRNR